MAVEKIIKVKAETDEAVKEVNKLNKATEQTGENVQQAQSELKGLDKQAKDTSKGTKGLGTAFKGLGTAMKAAGIGLIIAVVAKLTQAFSQNQAIMDGVNKVFSTINIVFQEVTTAITNAFQSTSEANGGFTATIAVVKNLMTLALTPLKLLFDGIKLTIQGAMLAWETSFFGDKDPKTIAELTIKINETKESIKQTGEEALKAGKGVALNFGDMIGEVSGFAEQAAENLKKVNVSAAKESAEALVELRKQVQLGESALAGLTLQFQKQAEEQRQQRDDVRLSIKERIEANQRLGEILKKQSQEELALANEKLSLAEQELALNPKNIEAQIALQEAKNGVLEIEERITGQKSEQLTNEAALLDEQKANAKELRKLGKDELEIRKEESQQQFEDQKLLIERTLEQGKERDRLIEAARQEHLTRINEIEDEDRIKREEFLAKYREETEAQKLEREETEALAELDRLKASEEEKARVIEFYAKKRRDIEEKTAEQKEAEEEALMRQTIDMTAQTFGAVADILGKESKAGKAFAIAQSLINTFQGITAALKMPFPLNIPSVAFAAATGFKAVKDIASTNVTNPSSSGGAASGGSVATPQLAQAPQFDLVGDAGVNQISETLNSQSNRPQRSYVVSSEMESQAQLERNIQGDASLG